jgi:hypothetical protein
MTLYSPTVTLIPATPLRTRNIKQEDGTHAVVCGPTWNVMPMAQGGQPEGSPTWNFMPEAQGQPEGSPTWNFMPEAQGQPEGTPTWNMLRPGTLEGPTSPTKKEKTKKKKSRQEVWTDKCKLVHQYVVEHGKSPPQQNCTVVNDDGARVDIGRWWSTQRTAQNAGKLTAARELQMKTIDGLKWGPTRQEVWTDKCKLVKQYVVEHGQVSTTTKLHCGER